MVSRKVIMAEKRMFALKIIDSDAFLDMSTSAQNLYFHLAMRADDDGFISAPKKIMRIIGASIDDLRLLADTQLHCKGQIHTDSVQRGKREALYKIKRSIHRP